MSLHELYGTVLFQREVQIVFVMWKGYILAIYNFCKEGLLRKPPSRGKKWTVLGDGWFILILIRGRDAKGFALVVIPSSNP